MICKIDTQTVLCISVAGRPGNFGNRFHNFLYAAHQLNYIYKACSTTNLACAIDAIRALKIRGCGVSMPFKVEAIQYLDKVDNTVKQIGAINTIVNDEGILCGYNTDYIAVKKVLATSRIPANATILVNGSGGMARAICAALKELGYEHCFLKYRNATTGKALLSELKFIDYAEMNHNNRFDVLINATPMGMAGGSQELPFPQELVQHAKYVCDAVTNPKETAILKLAKQHSKQTMAGTTITLYQAVEQFKLYTGIEPKAEFVEQAFKYAIGD